MQSSMTTLGDCAVCADAVYRDGHGHPLRGAWRGGELVTGGTGFQGRVYRRDGAVIVAYRGTDSMLDQLLTWSHLAAKAPPWAQLLPAMNLARRGLQEQPHRIVLTGHSLGGALAKVVATHLGIPAVLFNAPDVAFHLGAKRPWIKSIAAQGDPVAGLLGSIRTLAVQGLTAQEVRERLCLPADSLSVRARHAMSRIRNAAEQFPGGIYSEPVPVRRP